MSNGCVPFGPQPESPTIAIVMGKLRRDLENSVLESNN